MNKNIVNTKFLVSTALIAAIYVVMTLAIAPLSFGMIQIRISEVLMLMAFIDKKYAPGLVLGCFIANCFSPFGMMDAVFGTACTAASLVGITKCSKTLFGASLWPVLCNAFIGIELYLFGSPLLLSGCVWGIPFRFRCGLCSVPSGFEKQHLGGTLENRIKSKNRDFSCFWGRERPYFSAFIFLKKSS